MKCCGTKKRRLMAITEAELLHLQKCSRFSLEELKTIRNRFFRISSPNHLMTKSQFRENMGLLGLETVFFISDRLFDMIDGDKDSLISLKEFVQYMDVMVNGSQKEKYLLSFKLVDTENKGFFLFQEFSLMINSMVTVWTTLTGSQISADIGKKLEFYIKYIFDEMDLEKTGRVSLNSYIQSLEKCPDLLEIYDFMNNSFNSSSIFEASMKKQKDKEAGQLLEQIRVLESDICKLASNLRESSPKTPTKVLFGESLDPNAEYNKPEKKTDKIEDEAKIDLEITHNNSSRTLKKIDASVKKLLLRANLNPEMIKSHEMGKIPECENIPTEDMSERIVGAKLQPLNRKSSSKFKAFRIEFSRLRPKFEEKEEWESEQNIGSPPKSPSEKDKRPNWKAGSRNEDGPGGETGNVIKRIQQQIKSLRTQMEEQVFKDFPEMDITEKNKSQLRARSFTIYNVHKITKPDGSKNFKGKIVFLGHENWNFVLNMMLGIQMAARSVVWVKDYTLSPHDFKVKFAYELIPRRIKNSKDTTKICKFFDYAPYAFHEIRTLFGITTDDYLKSIGPESMLSNLMKGNLTTLTELVSCGKSGSFFYYTADGRFTLKTIHRSEFHFLMGILKNYFEYVSANPQTLIVKFFGLHKIRFKFSKRLRWKKIYLIIMSNVFHTSKEIHERYDIKGSTYKRFTKEMIPSIVKKDLNAIKNNFRMKLKPEQANCLFEQIRNDCRFFERNQIIDYSLLIGIHRNPKKREDNIFLGSNLSVSDINTAFKLEEEGMVSSDGSEEYFIGIIDILTSFNTKKKLEFLFKTLAVDRGISAIPPTPYSMRLQNFVKKQLIQLSVE